MSGEMAIALFVICASALFFRTTLSKAVMLHPRLRKALMRLTEYAIVVVITIIICSLFGAVSP